MPRVVKILALVAACCGVLCGIVALVAYEASQQVPDFYREALAQDPDDQRSAADEFVAQVALLASDLQREGTWQGLFTDEQINAWLALELPAAFPEVLDGQLTDPRISLRENEATIACRYDNGTSSVVVSLSVDAYLQEPNVLALRIRRVRVGSLPVALGQVLEGIAHAARELDLRLEWRRTHGDPVALITFPHTASSHAESLNFHAIELRDGELFVSGTIDKPSELVRPGGLEADDTPTAQAKPSEPAKAR